MEEIIATHQDVAECAVFGVEDELKGQLPIGLAVLKTGIKLDEEQLRQELARMIREEIGAIANFKQSAIVERLPKTRSGKILRGIMRKIADSKEYTIPSTIDDPAILGEIEEALKRIGYAK
jgi:propionyl-CoA synthetase